MLSEAPTNPWCESLPNNQRPPTSSPVSPAPPTPRGRRYSHTPWSDHRWATLLGPPWWPWDPRETPWPQWINYERWDMYIYYIYILYSDASKLRTLTSFPKFWFLNLECRHKPCCEGILECRPGDILSFNVSMHQTTVSPYKMHHAKFSPCSVFSSIRVTKK